MNQLTHKELTQLVRAVFPPLPGDKALVILVDIPNEKQTDTPAWKERRTLAAGWSRALKQGAQSLGLQQVNLVAYASVDSNNADLPDDARLVEDDILPDVSSDLRGDRISFDALFSTHQLYLAPTQFSTTAPLKVAAKKYGFRAATMPGFSAKMIPALRIDYGLVNERCRVVKELLDDAVAVDVHFMVDNRDDYHVHFDTRHRTAHASGGRFPDAGTAGNLPSGETYIVPYEGELKDASETDGTLPVQFDDEIVLFQIKNNCAAAVLSNGKHSDDQAARLQREPAYGNMAELGFGVLGDFGLQPIDEILLDEKLAFHVAFGRSDHFGGDTGPDKFSSPAAVVHIDRIYSPMMQPRIKISSIDLKYSARKDKRILQDTSI